MAANSFRFPSQSDNTPENTLVMLAVALPAHGSVPLRARLSFREMTTRKHYPGTHAVEIMVNGVPFPLGSVELLRA